MMTTGLGRIPELPPKSKVGNEGEGEVEEDLADIRCAFQSCIQFDG